ncbi:MAG TPA: exonuclease subunit SbcD [Deltaproteobacteria bacterium]|nr:exonuclease subunit SbcD [Deltaproteobacteria bacterium]
MRILHTSDWHLGKRLESFFRLEEQKAVLEEICAIAEKEQADAVLVAGDLFDTYNPPTEAVDLFYKTVKKLAKDGQRAVIAIAGNHDSPASIEAPDPLARECGIIFAGYPHSKVAPFKLDTGLEVLQSDNGFIEMKLPGQKHPLRLLLTPYANEYRLKKFLGIENPEEELRKTLADQWKNLADQYCDKQGVNILISHLYFMQKGGEKPEEPEAEKPILHMGGAQEVYTENIPEQIQYTALGHLHRRQTVDSDPSPTIYSGSPLAYSFSEAGQDKYVVMMDVEPGQPVKHTPVKLIKGRPLLRKRFEEIEKAVNWLKENPEALVELTIITDQFLTSKERKQLSNVHDSIVTIIPELKDKSLLDNNASGNIDLSQNIKSLFKQYFEHKHGQEPNKQLMELFKEVLAEDTEE